MDYVWCMLPIKIVKINYYQINNSDHLAIFDKQNVTFGEMFLLEDKSDISDHCT